MMNAVGERAWYVALTSSDRSVASSIVRKGASRFCNLPANAIDDSTETCEAVRIHGALQADCNCRS